MKKTLYFLVALFALSFTFIACSDDDESGTTSRNSSFSVTPEIAAAGTYSGTFKRVQDGATDTTSASGTVIVTATDSAYCADFTFTSTDFSLSATSVANITYANSGFSFQNNVTTNGLGAAFAGRIDESKTLTVKFTISQGRRPVIKYNYTFTGTLVEQ